MNLEISIKKSKLPDDYSTFLIYRSQKSLKRDSWYFDRELETISDLVIFFKDISSWKMDDFKFKIIESKYTHSHFDPKKLMLLRVEHGF